LRQTAGDERGAVEPWPVTRYVTASDGVSIAYKATGDGPMELLFLPGFGVPIDLLWEEPNFVRFAKRLASFTRTVWYEPRGSGASGGDYLDNSLVDTDKTTVLDAAGCGRVVIVGSGNTGPAAIRYAVAYPDRVRALVLIGTFAHYVREEDYPWGFPPEALKRFNAASEQQWGTGAWLDVVAPNKTADEGFRAWWSRSERLAFAPNKIGELARITFVQDVRPLLASIAVPTLVLHRVDDNYIRVGAGRYLAEHISSAKFVELSGEDNLFFVGDADSLLDEIEEFLTGSHQAPEGDLLMAAILFTDIVASTEQSAQMGHRKWRALTEAHDAMVRSTLARHRGREVKTTGDGFLATFDATTRAVRAATEIAAAAKHMSLDVRAGVHIGEVEVQPDDVVGLAVSIAKRVCDLAAPGQVLVSESVRGLLVGSGITLAEQGTHVLRGVPDEWRLFAVTS
jgi:class 3 adenylate cyclase/pimeloyl-ACP methyl ester carboxylesterase